MLNRLSIVLLLVGFTTFVSAQKVVTGKVNDDRGSIVSNVVVQVKDSPQTVQTDEEGKFSIEVADENATILLTKEGYETSEVALNGKSSIEVSMVLVDLMALSLDDLMNTMVMSSSFFSLKSKDTPGYVFTQDMSKLHSPRTLSDMVRMVIPGTSDGAHRESEIIGVRGMKVVDNSKTLVMFDGESLNQRGNLGYWNGFSTPLLGDVKTVEVGLSPNAIVHGSGAISGYINMLPKNGHDNKGLMANVTGGVTGDEIDNNFYKQVELGYGFDFGKKKNVYIYGGFYENDGATADSSLTINPKSTYLNNGYSSLLYKSMDSTRIYNTYKPDFKLSTHVEWNNFSLNAGYQEIWRSINLDVQQNYQRIFNVRPKYVGKFNEYESVEISAATELFDAGTVKNDKNGEYSYGGSEAHYEGKFVFKTTRLNKNSLALGGLYGIREFNTQDQYFGSTTSDKGAQYIYDPFTNKNSDVVYANGLSCDGKWSEMAFFIEDIYNVTEKITVSGGLRYDYFNIEDLNDVQQNISPRLAASYAFSDNSTLKLSYQQGFRTIDLSNLYQTQYNRIPKLNYANSDKNINLDPDLPAGTNSNFDQYSIELKPEKLNSFEISYHQNLKNNQISFDINGYYNNYQNNIDYVPLVRWSGAKYSVDPSYKGDVLNPGVYFTDEALQNWIRPKANQLKSANTEQGMYLNMAEDINIVGSEVIVNYRPLESSEFKAVYSYNYALEETYRENSTCPTHQLKLSATQYLLADKLMLNSLFLYEPGKDKNSESELIYHDVYFTDRTVLDFSVAYKFCKYLTAKATATNLLGENNPGIMYKPLPATTTANTTTENLGLGRDKRMYFVTLSFAL